MSLFRHINEISDKGSLKVRGSMMQAIARICLDIITRTKDAPYNWDVIALYCASPNASHKQKERYDGADTLTFLKTWLTEQADVSSTDVARALQALEYIVGTSDDPGDTTALANLENQISAEYQRVGSPLSQDGDVQRTKGWRTACE